MQPTKEQLRDKYQIDNDDFEILSEFPTDQALQDKKSFIVYVGEFLGVPAWLWKTVVGTIVGVILITSFIVDSLK